MSHGECAVSSFLFNQMAGIHSCGVSFLLSNGAKRNCILKMDSKNHSNTIGVLISFRLLFNWGIVICETIAFNMMVCAPLYG